MNIDKQRKLPYFTHFYNSIINKISQLRQYRHAYFIKDTNLVCPKYVISFTLPDHNVSLQQQQQQLHKVQLSRDQSLLYFDPVTLTSVHPRDVNNSQNGGMYHYAERNLIPVDQAFDQAVQEMQRLGSSEDLSVVRKKDWIEKHLTTLEDKVRDINLNYAEVWDGIQEAADLAVKKLQSLTRGKLETCLSMEIELRRQLEQLDWSVIASIFTNSTISPCLTELCSFFFNGMMLITC